jgi:hypothetical protein
VSGFLLAAIVAALTMAIAAAPSAGSSAGIWSDNLDNVFALEPAPPAASGLNIRIETPPNYDSTVAPKGIIFYAHAYSGDESEPIDNEQVRPTIKALLDAGYIVASSDDANSVSKGFGSKAAVEALEALYAYVHAHYPPAPIILMGASAGGSLITVAQHRKAIPEVVGMAMVCGYVNIAYTKGHTEGWVEEVTESAYGITPHSTWANFNTVVEVPELEPMELAEGAGDKTRFQGVPIFYAGSTEDQIVNYANNATKLKEALTGYDTVTLYPAKGTHMSKGMWEAAATHIVAWANKVVEESKRFGGPAVTNEGAATKEAAALIPALLAGQLTPSGKKAKIAALLKSGGFTVAFKALEAGTVVINWYYLPPGAKLAKKAKPKPVLVASGKLTFSAAGTAKVKLKLTAAGKSLLKHAKKLKLTAKGTFTPTGKTPITASKTFVLKR